MSVSQLDRRSTRSVSPGIEEKLGIPFVVLRSTMSLSHGVEERLGVPSATVAVRSKHGSVARGVEAELGVPPATFDRGSLGVGVLKDTSHGSSMSHGFFEPEKWR